MKTTTTILLALLLIFTLAATPTEATLIVNKYTNDFTLSSPNNEQLKACACEIKPDLLITENIGNFEAQYHLSLRSPVSNWMTLAQSEFTLAPKHRNEVLNYIEVPCGAVGTYDYTVQATSSFGREETLTRTLRADVCQNIELIVTPRESTTNLCEAVDYNIRLRNVGTFAETYTLSFESYNEFMEIETREIYLQPGQEHSQQATLTLPCNFYGDYTIPFVASASKNMIEEKTTALLHVENQFDHSIDVDTQVRACSRVTETIPVTITNRIDVENDFTIRVAGPRFVDTQEATRTITLGPNQATTINLDVNAKPGDEGTHNLRINVKSKYGEVDKTRNVELVIEDCYNFDVEMRDQEQQKITQDTACCGQREYSLNIRNQGTSYETFNIINNGPAWFTTEVITVDLYPGESKNVKIFAQIPCMDETYTAPITIVNNNHPSVNHTIPFVISSQTQRTCHYVGIDYDEFKINKDSTVVPVMVKHNGSQGGLYNVRLESELFTLVEDHLEIHPGETRILHLETNNLGTKEYGRYISQPIFTFTQDNNPTANLERDLDYVEHIGTQLTRKNLFTRACEWVSNNWWAPGACGWVGITLLTILIVLLIGLLFGLGIVVNENPAIIIKALLVLLAIISLFVFATTLPGNDALYEEPTGEHFIEIRQNTQETINLDRYFDDPDEDILSYSATQPRDLAVTIRNNQMTITPDYGFTGMNEIVITADDSFGGITDSPVLEIRVLAREELGLLGFWLRYCLSINLLLLALILLVLTGYVKTKKKTKKAVEKKHTLILPPKKPKKTTRKAVAKKTVRKTTRKTVAKKAAKKTTKKVAAKKMTRKVTAKKTVVKSAPAKQSARSMALDRALVSQEDHEMKQVLSYHNKRQTNRNIKILRQALRDFKNSKYKTKNRETFYRYLKEQRVLQTLHNK